MTHAKNGHVFFAFKKRMRKNRNMERVIKNMKFRKKKYNKMGAVAFWHGTCVYREIEVKKPHNVKIWR